MNRVANILKGICFVVIVSLVGVYVSDWVWIEYRLGHPTGTDALGAVTFYSATMLKNGRLEVFYNQPQSEVCVYSLIPHVGYRPCWYAVRDTVRAIGQGRAHAALRDPGLSGPVTMMPRPLTNRGPRGGGMMRTIWISWAAVAFLAVGALALPARVGAQQSATGTWTGTARGVAGSRQFEEDFTMELTQSGQKVTGTFSRKFETGAKAKSGRERTNVPVNGTLTGDKLSLTIGKQQTLDATIDGDSMTGSILREKGTPHHVSATRAK